MILYARNSVFDQFDKGPLGFIWTHPKTQTMSLPDRFYTGLQATSTQSDEVYAWAFAPMDLRVEVMSKHDLQHQAILYAKRAVNVLDQKAAILALQLLYGAGSEMPPEIQQVIVDMMEGVAL